MEEDIMDPKLIFWALALANMAAILLLAGRGWWCIRKGDVAGHLRAMYGAAALVLLFLVAYGGKVLWIGKEDLAAWSASRLAMLRLHEVFVTGMLLAGIGARLWVRRRGTGRGPAVSPRHALAGRTALVAGALALITAALVFVGMLSADRGGVGSGPDTGPPVHAAIEVPSGSVPSGSVPSPTSVAREVD
jgi:uncharacterized membrane protein YozB (DUF420 family)